MLRLACCTLLLALYVSARGQLHYGPRFYSTSSYNRPTYTLTSSSSSRIHPYSTSSSVQGSAPWWSQYFQYDTTSAYPDEREVLPEWFEVEDGDDCDNVPNTVNTGRPRDLCGDNDLGVRFCICMKRRNSFAGVVNTYSPICGECRDPCALRFVPDSYPRRRNNDDDIINDDVGVDAERTRN